jgi:hypothetical protein
MKLADYIIVWTDTVPGANGLADAAREHGGGLLAAAGIHELRNRIRAGPLRGWWSPVLVPAIAQRHGLPRSVSRSTERHCTSRARPVR